ncbi:MAG TPA: PhnD/SsuA/transferrin family substrate-binding protein [Pseudonocardiaceae bacterium]
MRTLGLGYFSASPVLAVARARGLFARAGLRIEAEPVTSSPAQFRSLRDGDYHLVLTSPDNVAAYRFGTANALGGQLDTRIIRAVDGGLGLSLLGAAGVHGVDDLRGGVIGVDVSDSGFAFALYELLASNGLRRGTDYEIVELGSTPRRAEALRAGRCDATLLNGGLVLAAQRDGLVNLGRISDVVRPYLGTVLAATGRWLDTDRAIARRFCDVWQQAVTALLAAEHEIAPLLADVFHLSIEEIPAIRTLLNDPAEGLVPDGAVVPAALDNVLHLRARYGRQEATAEGLVDPC